MHVEIYVNGSWCPYTGDGGWAAILLTPSHCKEISGFEGNTTNNRMELLSAIKGLEKLKCSLSVNVYSRNLYLINPFLLNSIEKWKNNDWKLRKNRVVANQDLWENLFKLSKLHKITWTWNNKISSEEDNRASQLAMTARKTGKYQETLSKLNDTSTSTSKP